MNKVRTDGDAIYRYMNNPLGPVIEDVSRRADNIVRYSKSIAPVDTGALRDSIRKTLIDNGFYTYFEIGSHLEYAIYVELGTSVWPDGKPYLRPALKAGKE